MEMLELTPNAWTPVGDILSGALSMASGRLRPQRAGVGRGPPRGHDIPKIDHRQTTPNTQVLRGVDRRGPTTLFTILRHRHRSFVRGQRDLGEWKSGRVGEWVGNDERQGISALRSTREIVTWAESQGLFWSFAFKTKRDQCTRTETLQIMCQNSIRPISTNGESGTSPEDACATGPCSTSPS